MGVINLLLSFICLSFFILIVGAIALAMYLKSRMDVFKEVQADEEAFYNTPVIDAQYHTVGMDESPSPPVTPAEITFPHHDQPLQ